MYTTPTAFTLSSAKVTNFLYNNIRLRIILPFVSSGGDSTSKLHISNAVLIYFTSNAPLFPITTAKRLCVCISLPATSTALRTGVLQRTANLWYVCREFFAGISYYSPRRRQQNTKNCRQIYQKVNLRYFTREDTRYILVTENRTFGLQDLCSTADRMM